MKNVSIRLFVMRMTFITWHPIRRPQDTCHSDRSTNPWPRSLRPIVGFWNFSIFSNPTIWCTNLQRLWLNNNRSRRNRWPLSGRNVQGSSRRSIVLSSPKFSLENPQFRCRKSSRRGGIERSLMPDFPDQKPDEKLEFYCYIPKKIVRKSKFSSTKRIATWILSRFAFPPSFTLVSNLPVRIFGKKAQWWSKEEQIIPSRMKRESGHRSIVSCE